MGEKTTHQKGTTERKKNVTFKKDSSLRMKKEAPEERNGLNTYKKRKEREREKEKTRCSDP